MTLPLTAKQEQLLRYIARCDRSPSYDEMKEAVGLKARSGVNRLLKSLEERGFVRRLPYRARSVEVIRRVPGPASEAPDLKRAKTSELLAELERRGILLGLPQ